METRSTSSRRRVGGNDNGSSNRIMRSAQAPIPINFQPPNDLVDGFGGCRPFPWCKCLSILILTAILTPTIWYIHRQFCATQKFFNKVEEDLCKIQEQMDRMKYIVEKGTNQQLEVKKMPRNDKSCPSNGDSSQEIDCCAMFDSDDGGDSEERPDFALESSGGSIIGIGDTEPLESETTIFGIPVCCSRNGPRAIIQPNVQPGECWAFKGGSGTVSIKLLGSVYISGVSLEHIPKSISPSGNIDSAPNEFSIFGLKNDYDKEGTLLGRFTYSCNGPPLQYFPIDECGQSYEAVELQIHSNQGNPRFTCVYRLQVHGKLDEDETLRLGEN